MEKGRKGKIKDNKAERKKNRWRGRKRKKYAKNFRKR